MTRIASPRITAQGAITLDASVRVLPHVGQARARTLEEEGMPTVYDLLTYLPIRYEDRSRFATVASLAPGGRGLLCLSVISARLIRTRRRDFTITETYLKDHTGTIKAIWFNRPYLAKGLAPDRRIVVFGEVTEKGTGAVLENPDYELLEPGDDAAGSPHFARVVPVYRRLRTLSGKGVRKLIWEALPALKMALVEPELALALATLHFPDSVDDAERARRDLAFRELLEFQTGLKLYRERRAGTAVRAPRVADVPACQERLRALAPFALTSDQRSALGRILEDLAGSRPMARLLHGEVGSGKTMVALLSTVPVLDQGRQVALLAPTEVLAQQLYAQALALLRERAGLNVGIDLLSAARRGSDRNQVLLRMVRGQASLVVGTHALFQERVAWKDLAYVVIDEQHRFGVFERRALMAKAGPAEPDLLVMSATPIPRTLTLTLYGDLDVTRIVEVPPGRTPVSTRVLRWHDRAEAYRALQAAVARSEQGFVVVPRISDDPKKQRSSLRSVERSLREKEKDWRIEVLHGQLGPDEKAEVAARLRSGRLDVVVATTVVEVGIDIPGASVIVVLGSEGYGLSQLHQLRGRTGRSDLPSRCFFVLSREAAAEAYDKVRSLEEVADGFQVAELDWRERGPGDVAGARQWGGTSFRVARLADVEELIDRARDDALSNARALSAEEITTFMARWERRFGVARVA